MKTVRRWLTALRMLCLGDGVQRRRVRQELARIAAGLFGDFPIADDYKLWREDREFFGHFRRLSPDAPYSAERKYVLREFVRYTANVAGDLAECGCYVGVSAWFMASEAQNRELFLFDSFEGLSEPQSSDRPANAATRAWKSGDMATSVEVVRANLADFDRIHIFEGWIPSRFQEIADRRFSLVHLDVDLYQPTLDSLAFFYPRLMPGGVIVMDDYGFLTCPGATKAADEYMANKPEYILHLPTGQGVIIRRAASTS